MARHQLAGVWVLHGVLAASGEWMGGWIFLQLLVQIACKLFMQVAL